MPHFCWRYVAGAPGWRSFREADCRLSRADGLGGGVHGAFLVPILAGAGLLGPLIGALGIGLQRRQERLFATFRDYAGELDVATGIVAACAQNLERCPARWRVGDRLDDRLAIQGFERT